MTAIFRQNVGTGLFGNLAGISTIGTIAMNEQNEAVGCVFAMPEDATIISAGFVCASVTGAAASIGNDTYTLSIQGVTALGMPDGTIVGGGTPASVTYPTAGAAGGTTLGTGTAHVLTLANSIAMQGGTMYSIVNQHTGATDNTNFATLRYGAQAAGMAARFPYSVSADNAGTWSKQNAHPWYFFLRSASKTYLYPLMNGGASQNIGTTTEAGFTFTVPSAFGTGNSFGLREVVIAVGTTGMTAGGTYTVNLYSNPTGANPSIIQTTGQLDSDVVAAATGNGIMRITWPDDAMAALVPGTKCCIGCSSSQATSWSIKAPTLPDAASKTAWEMGGMSLATRTLASAYPPDSSDGAFTESATAIVDCELVFGDFTAASGGGGIPMSRVFTGM